MLKKDVKEDESPLSEKTWYTKAGLAKYLGLSQRFIDLHIRPFVNIYRPNAGYSTKILFNREEVDEFIRSRKVGAELVIKP